MAVDEPPSNDINCSSTTELECEIESVMDNPASSGSGSLFSADVNGAVAIDKLHELYAKRTDDLLKLENDYEELNVLYNALKTERDALLVKLQTAGAENSCRVHELERIALDDQNQIRCLRDRIVAQEAQFHRLISEREAQFAASNEQLTRATEVAQREKDTAVIRYAERERDILLLEAANQKAAKEIKNLQSDRDVLRAHVISAKSERDAIMKSCERKDSDLAWYKKELDKMKAIVQEADNRQKESSDKIESLEETARNVRNELEAMKAKYEADGAVAEAPVSADQCSTAASVVRTSELNERLTMADKKITELEHEVQLKASSEESLRSVVDDLRERLRVAEERANELRSLNGRLHEVEADKAQAELEAARCREETERLLQLVERLTDDNVQLKTENLSLSSELTSISSADSSLGEMTERLQDNLKQSEERLRRVQDDCRAEVERFQLQLHQLAQSERDVKSRLEEEVNAMKVLKKKQTACVKELKGEIAILRKRLELCETSNASQGSGVSGCSRAASPSVETDEQVNQENAATTCEHNQMMIEKIVKLQRALARRNEKIEFLHENVKHLSGECRKKTRIIQAYVIREETGALTSNDSDVNKLYELLDQANIAKRGSTVMSNLFGVGYSNKEVTVELAVEMMRKFQSVLEDVLLKNIMLKENIQTLGQEIARLSRENREMQLRLIATGG